MRFTDGTIKGEFGHFSPLMVDDGGHGMLFETNGKLYFTFHAPNIIEAEHPAFVEMCDNGDSLSIK